MSAYVSSMKRALRHLRNLLFGAPVLAGGAPAVTLDSDVNGYPVVVCQTELYRPDDTPTSAARPVAGARTGYYVSGGRAWTIDLGTSAIP